MNVSSGQGLGLGAGGRGQRPGGSCSSVLAEDLKCQTAFKSALELGWGTDFHADCFVANVCVAHVSFADVVVAVAVAAAELLKLENCFHNARRSMLATEKQSRNKKKIVLLFFCNVSLFYFVFFSDFLWRKSISGCPTVRCQNCAQVVVVLARFEMQSP